MSIGHRSHARRTMMFVDSELDPRDLAKTLAHLSGCSRCHEDIAMVQTVRRSLQRISDSRMERMEAGLDPNG